MKKTLIAIALALGICSASAIPYWPALTIHQDTPHKLDATLDWSLGAADGLYNNLSTGTYLQFDWQQYGPSADVDVYMHSPFLPSPFDGAYSYYSFLGEFLVLYQDKEGFDPYNPGPPIEVDNLSSGTFDNLKIKLAQNLSSVRFTWKFDKDPIIPVPDTGSTLLLLAGGLGILILGRKFAIA